VELVQLVEEVVLLLVVMTEAELLVLEAFL
jgi:hypothetical protein